MPHYLVIKPSSFGDIVHGLQVAQWLPGQRSDTRFNWVVRKAFADLVEAYETVDQVLIFRRHGEISDFIFCCGKF